MTQNVGAGSWALKAQEACSWLFWIMTINALWIAFTLAGGIVFGIGPSALAAAAVTRKRLRNEKFGVAREFASTWRAEFVAGNLLMLPVIVVVTLLGVNAISFGSAGQTGLCVLSAVAGSMAFLLGALVVPMHAHYELPLRSYLPTAGRWALSNFAHVVLLAVAAVGIGALSYAVPGIIPFLSVGGWLVGDTVLCVAFFAANDSALAAAPAPGSSTPHHN